MFDLTCLETGCLLCVKIRPIKLMIEPSKYRWSNNETSSILITKMVPYQPWHVDNCCPQWVGDHFSFNQSINLTHHSKQIISYIILVNPPNYTYVYIYYDITRLEALQDGARLMNLLTYTMVEEAIIKRVEMKTRKYGQEVNGVSSDDNIEHVYKINPTIVAELYVQWIMPLTKQVQVEYLLRRLD